MFVVVVLSLSYCSFVTLFTMKTTLQLKLLLRFALTIYITRSHCVCVCVRCVHWTGLPVRGPFVDFNNFHCILFVVELLFYLSLCVGIWQPADQEYNSNQRCSWWWWWWCWWFPVLFSQQNIPCTNSQATTISNCTWSHTHTNTLCDVIACICFSVLKSISTNKQTIQ